MKHEHAGYVTIDLAESDYSDLIQLLDSRIKSERARAAAYKAHRDHSNQMVASGRMSQLIALRNAVVSGCRQEVDDV
ncbi:MAG: hypothetical protein JJ974_01595 [Phycisphaerales bacterium]|nr:hypothetical protein [Phycisphaerales bacterium]